MENAAIKNLSRTVEVVDGKIRMHTQVSPGFQYAFYFRGKEGLTKKGYITTNTVVFNVPLQTGIYKATFFLQKR